MARYDIVKMNVEKIGEFKGNNVWRPRYRCKQCSRAIKQKFTTISEVCYDCNEGNVAVGEYVERVYAMTFYISDVQKTEFIKGIYDLKDEFSNVAEFSTILSRGFQDYRLYEADLIVVPPSGTAESDEENHMVPIGERLSEQVGISFENITYKKEGYPSQKNLGFEERIENVRGKIGVDRDTIGADKAIVIDDIATSCATVSATAQALIEAGVNEVNSLVIARDENASNLQYADVLKKVEE